MYNNYVDIFKLGSLVPLVGMQKNIEQIEKNYGQYKRDIFCKLGFPFISGKTVLDLGCGSGEDAAIFKGIFGLDTYALDVYEHENIKNLGIKFTLGSIYQLPYEDGFFDYIFLHDVLHHIDEKAQRHDRHLDALRELKRISKKGGFIIIVEGNRYNPLFYPHMVKMHHREHFTHNYFKNMVSEVFPSAQFESFEAHLYPKRWLRFWKFYEVIMEGYCPKSFLAYNVAVVEG